ncbi:hypothetical protein H0Z60_11785 [Ectothiorhodospiraceae bacterium WFHF3C12]|nr:hypothetical protein [Ectothiorhodospiraceae bacterium WFHF3C12]
MRYPPESVRGIGSSISQLSRRQRFGNYRDDADDEVCLIVRIETVDPVRNLDGIAATPGVDGLLIGPSDLSAAMGHGGSARPSGNRPDHRGGY